MSRLFLGVDGGQSSTTAWIGDESGRVLGIGAAGPCNHVTGEEGRARFTAAMTSSLSAACQAAGQDPAAVVFEAACLGFSGGPADKERLVPQFIKARSIQVTDDALIALTGATAGQPGVIVIAGTGSIAFGRNGDGDVARAGGWGYLFGDEGGAFDIVRHALRASLRTEEGWGPPTALRAALLEATGASSANELMHCFYTPDYPRDRVATLAPTVHAVASDGDAVALEILHHAGQQLAELATAVRGQLFGTEEVVRCSFVGGVFDSGYVRERFVTLLERDGRHRVGPPAHPPAAGALLEAYGAVGLSPRLLDPDSAEPPRARQIDIL